MLGFAVVAPSASHAEEIIDNVDRYVWSRLDLEIVSAERTWLEYYRDHACVTGFSVPR